MALLPLSGEDCRMAEDKEDLATTHEDEDGKEEFRRSKDLSKKPKLREKLLTTYKDVTEGYRDQWERSNQQVDYWDVYNCKLGPNQFYNGQSKIFVPIVHNAINARKTRFTNQIFPVSGRYVDCVS